MKVTAPWRQERPGPDPCYEGATPAVRRLFGGMPTESPPDQMHAWHHGVGRDFMASTIVPRFNGMLSVANL